MIKLVYMTNVVRRQIGTICPSSNSAYQTILSEILTCFENADITVDENKGILYNSTDNELKPLSEQTFTSGDCTIVYSEVIAPNNAYTFYEDDGIRFYYHTSEGNHFYAPHIHAEYSGDKISISLKDFRVKGKFHDLKKQSEAIKFVRKNQRKFIDGWNELIYEGKCPKWLD